MRRDFFCGMRTHGVTVCSSLSHNFRQQEHRFRVGYKRRNPALATAMPVLIQQ
jgi:hypothetical protein